MLTLLVFSVKCICCSLPLSPTVNHYPTEEMKRVLASKIGLTPTQVNVSMPAVHWCRSHFAEPLCRVGSCEEAP